MFREARLAEALADYLASGGNVTKCTSRIARGAEIQRPSKANIRFGRARTRSFRMSYRIK